MVVKCTKEIGPALSAVPKLPSCHLSQMENVRYSAVIVIGKNGPTAPSGSNQAI